MDPTQFNGSPEQEFEVLRSILPPIFKEYKKKAREFFLHRHNKKPYLKTMANLYAEECDTSNRYVTIMDIIMKVLKLNAWWESSTSKPLIIVDGQ